MTALPVDMFNLTLQGMREVLQSATKSPEKGAAGDLDQNEKTQKLNELMKKIEDLRNKIAADVQKGDMGAIMADMKEILAIEKEIESLIGPTLSSPSPAVAGASSGFPFGGQAGAPSFGGTPAASGARDAGAAQGSPSAPINLSGDDKKTADFINSYLAKKGSPAAGKGAGEMMVKYGKQYNVDPLILLAIAGQETQWGKTGIGVNGMLGVGAYDSDPNNATRNPTFSGIENQIRKGAETFAKLRAKGGASAGDSIAAQVAAANKAGWATDSNWHKGVAALYAQIAQAASGY
jgi:hypothetical protein